MENILRHIRLLTAIIAVGFCISMNAQNYHSPSSLSEAIEYPVIKDNKTRTAIVNYQNRQANILAKDYNVNLKRNNEVIVITIPADLFFESNETKLSSKADDILYIIAQFLRMPGFYHVALAMYHDNTGSPQYCKDMTDRRMQSICDWFSIYSNSNYVSCFSCGDKNPILPNNSMNNRRMNRRLEVYLVPDNTMFDNAKRNLLK